MSDRTRTVAPLEKALVRLDAMLAGLADGHDDYRSAGELLGAILAVHDRVRDMRRQVAQFARGPRQPVAAARTNSPPPAWNYIAPPPFYPSLPSAASRG